MLAAWILAACAGVPGPDSTAVIAASGDVESVALAERYAAARGIPERHVCALGTAASEDISLADFRTQVSGAIDACLDAGGVRARIEALVLVRGLPLRVVVPTPGIGGGQARVSMAAALALGDTATATGTPLLGQSPGQLVSCGGGGQCWAARWTNPFRSGVFRAGWSLRQSGLEWRPRIVTMLHGRSAADAARLVASATTAEALGGAQGTFLFMNGADPARGALDFSYPAAMAGLGRLGLTDVERVPFAADLTGRTLAALFVGTAALGRTIEGNTYAPGALVDNLTSFGAVAENFRASGEESQVSIARWVAQGVAGVHGTTDEPLNNCFPSRDLIVAYAQGGTLGEAYARALPFAYWHNLVLGDPMAAPYAVRPRVIVDGLEDGEVVAGSRRIEVRAEDPRGRTIDALALYVDGVERATSGGEPIEACIEAGEAHVLAVAQVADERTDETRHRPKGWASLRVTGAPGPSGCVEAVDAGAAEDGAEADSGADAGLAQDAALADAAASGLADASVVADAAEMRPALDEGGCGCTASPRGSLPGALSCLALAMVARVCRRRSR